MASHPIYQDYLDLIEEVGGVVTRAEQGRKHVKIYFRADNGGEEERFYVAPLTPSDRRGLDNARSTIRRILDTISPKQHERFEDVVEEQEERPTVDTFAVRLRRLREQQQMSRAALAEKAGVNEELIEHFEVYPEQPYLDYETILKITTALGTTLSHLTAGAKLEGAPDMASIGERARNRRNELGLTIGMIAERTGIPMNQIANLETGTFPDFYRIAELAKGLECSEEYLRTGAEEKRPMPFSEAMLAHIRTDADFGKFIADRRYALDLTQSQVGKVLGMYTSDISKAERGIKVTPFLKRLDTLAKVLQLPYNELKVVAERVRPGGPSQPGRPPLQARSPQQPRFELRKAAPATTPPLPQQPPKPEPEVVAAPTQPQPSDAQSKSMAAIDFELLIAAIRDEGNKTRNAIEAMMSMLSALREDMSRLQTQQAAPITDLLHTMIDNLFGKK